MLSGILDCTFQSLYAGMVVQKYHGHHQHMKSLPLAAGVDPINSLPQFEALHAIQESYQRSKLERKELERVQYVRLLLHP